MERTVRAPVGSFYQRTSTIPVESCDDRRVVGDDVQALLDGLAAELASSLALEDVDQRLVAHTDQGGAMDEVRLASILGRRATSEVRSWFEQWGIRDATEPVRTPAGGALGALARWCVPVRYRGTLLGYVWVLDDGRLQVGDLGDAVEVAGQIGSLLWRRRLAERADAELVRLLVLRRDTDEDPAIADAYPHRGAVAIVVVGTLDGSDLERSSLAEALLAARRAGESFPPGTLVSGAVGGLVVAIVPLRDTADLGPARRYAASLRLLAGRQLRGLDLAAGVGGASASVADVGRGHAEARRALRIARAIPGLGPVAAWDDLGVFRALALVPPDQVASSALDPRVRTLLAAPALARTAEAFLDLAGDAAATSARLSIHRATLYQRLARIRTLTGLDLMRSGEDRLAAHLGVRLVLLTDRSPGTVAAG
jgi:GAF domain-containing protein